MTMDFRIKRCFPLCCIRSGEWSNDIARVIGAIRGYPNGARNDVDKRSRHALIRTVGGDRPVAPYECRYSVVNSAYIPRVACGGPSSVSVLWVSSGTKQIIM